MLTKISTLEIYDHFRLSTKSKKIYVVHDKVISSTIVNRALRKQFYIIASCNGRLNVFEQEREVLKIDSEISELLKYISKINIEFTMIPKTIFVSSLTEEQDLPLEVIKLRDTHGFMVQQKMKL